jgi:hypothetical protein
VGVAAPALLGGDVVEALEGRAEEVVAFRSVLRCCTARAYVVFVCQIPELCHPWTAATECWKGVTFLKFLQKEQQAER